MTWTPSTHSAKNTEWIQQKSLNLSGTTRLVWLWDTRKQADKTGRQMPMDSPPPIAPRPYRVATVLLMVSVPVFLLLVFSLAYVGGAGGPWLPPEPVGDMFSFLTIYALVFVAPATGLLGGAVVLARHANRVGVYVVSGLLASIGAYSLWVLVTMGMPTYPAMIVQAAALAIVAVATITPLVLFLLKPSRQYLGDMAAWNRFHREGN
jgi:hypothetical protein